MKDIENKEKKSESELLYEEVVKGIEEKKIVVPDDLDGSFLGLDKLSEKEQLELIGKLSKSKKLPKIMLDFIELVQFKQAPFLKEVPEEIPEKISIFADNLTLSSLALTSKTVNTLFKSDRVFTKFLQQAAYGGQDKIEKLFTLLLNQERDKEIQELLCKSGTVTDYSGRTFKCTAYEYAYWAKDRHMCRMLERFMDENTKALMLKRCEEIEEKGLTYTQNGKEIKGSKHFDLTPLKTALKEYADGFDNWYDTNNWDAINKAWMKVGLAQRDVPAHVIHEYCRDDRSFDPAPKFNEDKLPRGSTFYNYITNEVESLLPLRISNYSGLGVDFSLLRAPLVVAVWSDGGRGPGARGALAVIWRPLAA